MLAVDRDIKPRNMNFAKVERGGAINREGAFIAINTVFIRNSLNAIVFKLQVILLKMVVTEKPKSSYYSLSY